MYEHLYALFIDFPYDPAAKIKFTETAETLTVWCSRNHYTILKSDKTLPLVLQHELKHFGLSDQAIARLPVFLFPTDKVLRNCYTMNPVSGRIASHY